MKKKITSITIALLLCICNSAFGQSLGGVQRNVSEFLSPQVASMLRFDKSSVDLNAGRVNLEIPLMDFPDRDFNFPIRLRYDSSGFKPREPENYVGINWSLQPMYAIYREVKGMPDDHPQTSYLNLYNWPNQFCGFLAVRDHTINITKENVFKNPSVYAPLGDVGVPRIKDVLHNGKKIEASSDIYRFSVDGYSGYFMIDYDGSVKVVTTSGGSLTVDISQYRMIPEQGSKTNTSKIILKGDNGYTYIFGGSYSAMEYQAAAWDARANGYGRDAAREPHPKYNKLDARMQYPVITAFFLSKIVAHNGREMMIKYDTTIDDYYSEYHETPNEILWNDNWPSSNFSLGNYDPNRQQIPSNLRKCYQVKLEEYVETKEAARWTLTGANPADNGDVVCRYNQNDLYRNLSVKKIAILKSIETDDKYVSLGYSQRKTTSLATCDEIKYTGLATPTEILTAIYYRTNLTSSVPVKTTTLKYNENNGHLFLTEVDNYKDGKYQFEYVGMNKGQTSRSIDHWGFWRGGSAGGHMPVIRVKKKAGTTPLEGHYNDYKVLSNDRNPTGIEFDRNMLSKVTFPTGGSAVYTYGKHEFSYLLYQGPPDYIPVLLGPDLGKINDTYGMRSFLGDLKCGGTRIKNIKYYEGDSIVKQTNYIYDKGILSHYPRYAVGVSMPVSQGSDYVYYMVAYNSNGYYNMHNYEDHIKYSQVTEIDGITDEELSSIIPVESKGENGRKITTFSDLFYNEEMLTTSMGYGNSIYTWEHAFSDWLEPSMASAFLWNSGDLEFYERGFLEYGYKSQEIGKILFEQYYSSTGKLLKEVRYNYSIFPREANSSYSRLPYMVYANTANRINGTYSGNWTQINKKYFYRHNLVKKTILDNYENGSTITQVEEYDYDEEGYYLRETKTSNSDGSISRTEYKYLKDREPSNTSSPALPTETWHYRDNKFLFGSVNEYTAPEALYDYYGNFVKYPMNLLSKSYMTTDKNLNPMNEFKSTEYMRHDKYGNPVHVIKNGVSTVYLWWYSGTHLIAKIENATPEQVNEVINIDDIQSLEQQQIPSLFNWLRNNQKNGLSLKNAFITTCLWRPLVGIEQLTDPSGRTTYYKYDGANRLSEISREGKNGEIEIVNSYQYKLANE